MATDATVHIALTGGFLDACETLPPLCSVLLLPLILAASAVAASAADAAAGTSPAIHPAAYTHHETFW
jgi:hypothetical protein